MNTTRIPFLQNVLQDTEPLGPRLPAPDMTAFGLDIFSASRIMSIEDLESRVRRLTSVQAPFSEEILRAYGYIQPDSASSLTKSRMVLEKLLIQVYVAEMGKAPRKPQLGEMLTDNQFTRRIERRILSRMNAIRDLGNLGPHGERVEASDAARVLDDLCEVLDWYLQKCTRQPQETETRPAYLTLEVMTQEGKSEPRRFDPSQDRRIILGRAAECDVCLTDLGASRKHAMIVYDTDKGWILKDLSSSHGVFLNGRRVSLEAFLKADDIITIGHTVIIVRDLC